MDHVLRWSGRETRALRQARRMSIREFADRLGIAERTVSKWEARGAATHPYSALQATLDEFLAASTDEECARFSRMVQLANDEPRRPGTAETQTTPRWLPGAALSSDLLAPELESDDDSPVDRRDLLKSAGGVAGLALDAAMTGGFRATSGAPVMDGGEDGLDAPISILARMQWIGSSGIDEATLSHLERTVADVVRDSERIPPKDLAPTLRMLRNQVDHALKRHQHPGKLVRLYAASSYLSGLLGSAALDLGNLSVARAYAAEAYQLAFYLEDPDISAWARATQSLVEYYSGDHPEALRLSLHGQEIAPQGPHTARLVINGEARARAAMGDARGVKAAVARAVDMTPRLPAAVGMSPSLSLAPYCYTRVAANAATAYLAVGDTTRAYPYITDSLPVIDDAGLSGPRALTRIDLALAILNEDTGQACEAVDQAITIADRMSVRQRAASFVQAAGPWAKKGPVRGLAERLADLPRIGGTNTTGTSTEGKP